MKKLPIIILILIALIVLWFVWQNTDSDPAPIIDATTEDMIDTVEEESAPIVAPEDTAEQISDEETIAEDMESINAEILEILEAQAEIGLDNEELTDEDIRLIQEILDAITESAQ